MSSEEINVQCTSKSGKEKKITWSDMETEHFITLMIEKQTLKQLDSKRFRSADIFKGIEKEMLDAGFIKGAGQLQTKFKNLKYKYHESKRHNRVSGNDPSYCPHYELLDRLLGGRPTANTSSGYGFDSSEMVEVLEVQYDTSESTQLNELSSMNDLPEEGSAPAFLVESEEETPKTKKKVPYSNALLDFGEKNIKAQSNLLSEYFCKQEALDVQLVERFEQSQNRILEKFMQGFQNILYYSDANKHRRVSSARKKKQYESSSSNSD